MNIVLVEPEIPQNTGNISRTCACTASTLHLVGKLGFSTDDKHLKRSGLDYWHMLDIRYYDSWDDFVCKNKDGRYWFCTTKAPSSYTEVSFDKNDFLIFGKETKGLPEELLKANLEKCIRIPMLPAARSLNLSNSVAIVLYEALRQIDFFDLSKQGKFADTNINI